MSYTVATRLLLFSQIWTNIKRRRISTATTPSTLLVMELQGRSYCIAHHVTTASDKRTLMIASIRYLDKFVKQNGQWLFAERKLMVDWTERVARLRRLRSEKVISRAQLNDG